MWTKRGASVKRAGGLKTNEFLSTLHHFGVFSKNAVSWGRFSMRRLKHDMKLKGHDISVELNNPKITNLFSGRAFLMTPDDGVPEDDSPSQILFEMWR